MDPTPLIDQVLDDEGLTAGLDEREAMLLVRALTDRVRTMAGRVSDPATGRRLAEVLCQRARQIAATARAAPAGQAAVLLRRLVDEWPARPD
jgi:hypothetical protein